MAGTIGAAGMIVSALGIFFGFFFLSNKPQASLEIVTIATVGIGGILAFIRHIMFHSDDAKRLGWETDRPDWMFEVGFANLAFGGMALISVFESWGVRAQALALLGYALYLFQAAVLHGYRYFTDEIRRPSRLWRSFIATLLCAGCMCFFAVYALLR